MIFLGVSDIHGVGVLCLVDLWGFRVYDIIYIPFLLGVENTGIPLAGLVGPPGFEPGTSCTPNRTESVNWAVGPKAGYRW
jgi:hypothetical protein